VWVDNRSDGINCKQEPRESRDEHNRRFLFRHLHSLNVMLELIIFMPTWEDSGIEEKGLRALLNQWKKGGSNGCLIKPPRQLFIMNMTAIVIVKFHTEQITKNLAPDLISKNPFHCGLVPYCRTLFTLLRTS
jgi:hypothetical protein